METLFTFLIAYSAFAIAPVHPLTETNVPKIEPAFDQVYLVLGSSQQLKCSVVLTRQGAELLWSVPSMEGVVQVNQSIRTPTLSLLRNILNVENFTESNSGTYTCTLTIDDSGVNNASITLLLVEDERSTVLKKGNYKHDWIKLESSAQTGRKTKDEAPQLEPAVSKLYVMEGAFQELNCSANVTEKDAKLDTKLLWQTPSMKRFIQVKKSILTPTLSILQSSLNVVNFAAENAGIYTCQLIINSNTVNSASIMLIFVKMVKLDAVFDHHDKPATLSCKYELKPNYTQEYELTLASRQITWLRNFARITDREDKQRFTILEENNTLIINNPSHEDAGVYVSRFNFNESQQTFDCEVEFQAKPSVQKFEESKTLIEGDKLDLQCIVKSYPYANVTWYKDSNLINASEKVVLLPLGDYSNAHLTIKSVTLSDAGIYTCNANSSKFPNETQTQSIVLKIKGKYAAFWPFLGIVCEVSVLCTIIILYEQRRCKKVKQEENDALTVENRLKDLDLIEG